MGAQSVPSLSADFFETRIRPVLSTKCYACHSSRLAAPQGDLVAVVASAEPGKRVVGENELAKGRQWWTFQPAHELPKPVASHHVGTFTKLDHFVFGNVVKDILV